MHSLSVRCGSLIWEGEQDRDLTVVGQHWPTFVVTHFREPPILLPQAGCDKHAASETSAMFYWGGCRVCWKHLHRMWSGRC